MTVETTYDGEDNVTAVHVKPNTYTISFGKKVGKPNYGNEDFSLFAQIEIDPVDTFEDIEKKVDQSANFVKGLVYKHLGVQFGITDDGLVQAVEEAQAPAPPKRSGGGGQRSSAPASRPRPSAAEKEAAWQHLLDTPQDFFDNTQTKTNPKAPDFKGKRDTPYDGVGLWLESAPEWYTAAQEII
jgi:hypothetical protein